MNPMDTDEIIKAIQYVLAPAIMVSAAALLTLGFQNKSSNLASRFRLLNREKRQLGLKQRLTDHEEVRLKSVNQQIDFLVKRVFFIRNALISGYVSVIASLATSILLFANLYGLHDLYPMIIGIFILGLFMLLAAAFFMILETLLFYRVLRLEDRV